MTTEFPIELWRYPITYEKLRQRCKLAHTDPDFCGEAVYSRLPSYVTEHLTCHCRDEKDYREDVATLSSIGIPRIGHYCTLCGKPTRYTIVDHYFTCEGCDSFYTYDYRKFTEPPPKWPLPNLLCERCDVHVPDAVSRRRRTGIVFH